METKNKVVIGVVIIAVFAILAFTGVVNTTAKGTLIKECKGSSGSGDIYKMGTIMGTQANGLTYTKTDYCSRENPNILVEFKCDFGSQSGWSRDTIYCNNGCSIGACKKGSISDGLEIF